MGVAYIADFTIFQFHFQVCFEKGTMKIVLLLSLLVASTTCHQCDHKCTPDNWSYPWLRVGNSWFTVLNTRRAWYDATWKCSTIEKGRSSIASIRTMRELKILQRRYKGRYWLGGFKMYRDVHSWMWWNRSRVEKIKGFFWYRKMRNYLGTHSVCMYFYLGYMNDARCDYGLPAICELRC